VFIQWMCVTGYRAGMRKGAYMKE